MKEKSVASGRDMWLDDQPTVSAAGSRRQALLFQLCSKEAVWQHGEGCLYCVIASNNISQDGKEYNKFLQLLYIQGIVEGGYLAGAYPRDDKSFELRVSSTQLRQMREYSLALMRSQRYHTD